MPARDPRAMGYRPDIDGMRGLAVLLVLLYHVFPGRLPGGFVGVDVFFVISGYLISGILMRDPSPGPALLAGFYSRRVRRIFPALVLLLSAVLGVGYLLQLGGAYRLTGKQAVGAAFFCNNLLLWRESGYFDVAARSKPLLHLWSLGIEEQFYLLWPLLLLATRRWRWPAAELAAGLLVLSLGLCLRDSFVSSHSFMAAAAAFYAPWNRAWELMAGAWLALGRPTRLKWGWGLLGLALILVAAGGLAAGGIYPGWRAVVPVLGAALLIASGPQGPLARGLAWGPLAWLGGISYALYLWHWPLLYFARLVGPDPLDGTWRAWILASSLSLAWLSTTLVERPFRRPGREGLKLVALGAAMAVLVVLGAAIYLFNGLPQRACAKGLPSETFNKVPLRVGRCFLEQDQDGRDFAADCAGATAPARAPLVLLWGDSYAASLYPGLAHQASLGRCRVAQYTASGCPPGPGMASPTWSGCAEVNDVVSAKVKSLKPAWVVLVGNWQLYHLEDPGRGAPLRADLRAALSALRAPGRRVLLLGQLPSYRMEVIEDIGLQFVPGRINRTWRGLLPHCFAADETARRIARSVGVDFFSPMGLLCDGQGCRLSADPQHLVPLALDTGHLTPAGAVYVVEHSPLGGL